MHYLDKISTLSPALTRIICDKGTEYPHTGNYNEPMSQGTYLCRRCGIALFRAHSQFHASCGWPSFDEAIANNVKRSPDPDGMRTEIICNRCDAHLGHVFHGEYLTVKNLRFCVNSASLDFVENSTVLDSEEALVAGGCFWGVEHYMRRLPGVLKVESGYTGGHIPSPSYEQVCTGNSGHYEAVRVVYDKDITDYMTVLKRFFEIHDPTQAGGQGPDLGAQYQSAVFYYNNEQLTQAKSLIQRLSNKGFDVQTKLMEASIFWPAEQYHQNYYAKTGKEPYCHMPVLRFE